MGCGGSTGRNVQMGANGEQLEGMPEDRPVGAEEPYEPLTQKQINARIECCDTPQLWKLGSSGIEMKYAYLSQRGAHSV